MFNIDAGGFFQPSGPDSAAINRLMTEALSRLPVDVFNLNSDDLEFWPSLSQEAIRATSVISTNLRAPSDVPPPDEFAIRVFKAGEASVRIGFLGLADGARVPPRTGFTAIDPLEAIAQVKEKVLAKADFLVVLADLPDGILDQIAAFNPEVFVVVGLERRLSLSRPRQVANAVILKSVERGRFLGRLIVDLDPSGQIRSYRPEMIEMTAQVPEADYFIQRSVQLSSRNGTGGTHP